MEKDILWKWKSMESWSNNTCITQNKFIKKKKEEEDMTIVNMCVTSILCVLCIVSHVWLLATPWTVACQVPLPWGFSRDSPYWSGLPCPAPGDLLNPGIELRSPTLQEDSLLSETSGKPKNTEVGSLFLLKGIFLTQELNWGLLYCR